MIVRRGLGVTRVRGEASQSQSVRAFLAEDAERTIEQR